MSVDKYGLRRTTANTGGRASLIRQLHFPSPLNGLDLEYSWETAPICISMKEMIQPGYKVRFHYLNHVITYFPKIVWFLSAIYIKTICLFHQTMESHVLPHPDCNGMAIVIILRKLVKRYLLQIMKLCIRQPTMAIPGILV